MGMIEMIFGALPLRAGWAGLACLLCQKCRFLTYFEIVLALTR